MRRQVPEVLAAILVVTLGLTCRTTVPVRNQPTPTPTPTQTTRMEFYPQPQPLVVGSGDIFTVACVVEDVVDLVGLEVRIAWDTDHLGYVNHTATIPVENYSIPVPPSPHAGILHAPEWWIRNDADPVAGTYWVAYVTWGNEPSFNGSGTVFTITFQALAPTPSTVVHITNSELSDPLANPISHTTTDCCVEIGAVVYFDPGCVDVELGEEVEVAVVVEGVFDLCGLQAGITWDTAYLRYERHTVTMPVETHPGGLLHDPVLLIRDEVNETGVPDAPPGTTYWLTVTRDALASPFAGTGAAFTMTLRAIQQGTDTPGFTSLTLFDPDNNTIPYVSLDCAVHTVDTTPPDFQSASWKGTSPNPYVPSSFLRANEPVAVSVNITDLGGVAEALLSYRVDGGSWWNTTMTYNVTSDLWTIVIPGQPGNTSVEFFFAATDGAENVGTSYTYAYDVRRLLAGDTDGDGDVDIFDIVRVAGNYGKTLP